MKQEIDYNFIPTPTIFENILSFRTRNILNTLLNLQRMYGKANKLTIDGYFYLPSEELQRRIQTKSKKAIYPKLDTLFLHDLLSIKSVGQSKGKHVNYYRVKTENFKRYDNIKFDEIGNFKIKDIKSERGYKVKYLHPNCKKLVPIELLQREQEINATAYQQIIKGEIIPITKDILTNTFVSVFYPNRGIPFSKYNGNITLKEFIDNGENYKGYIEQAREAKEKGNQTTYKTLKQAMPAVTISATFDGKRNIDNITHINHILCLDIDGKEQTLSLQEIEDKLKEKDYIFYFAKSFSNDGIYALVEYQEGKEIEDVFNTIQTELSNDGIILDKHCKDITRLRIQSYDDTPYYNDKAIKYTNTLNKAYKESEPTTPSKEERIGISTTSNVNNNVSTEEFNEQIEYMEKLSQYCKQNHVTITRNHDETLFISRTLAATFGEIGKRWLVTIHKEQDYSKGKYIINDSDKISKLYESDLKNFKPSNQFEAIKNHIERNCNLHYINGEFQHLKEYRKAI
ncbi:MAG: hypothetical protein MJZ32_06165 [Bacteroidaceae bacterium]|nr:hypothetical protein [Bacteroidaceae bacterium]